LKAVKKQTQFKANRRPLAEKLVFLDGFDILYMKRLSPGESGWLGKDNIVYGKSVFNFFWRLML